MHRRVKNHLEKELGKTKATTSMSKVNRLLCIKTLRDPQLTVTVSIRSRVQGQHRKTIFIVTRDKRVMRVRM